MSYRERILRLLDVPPEGELTLAFSGGSDSLALASLLPKERTRCIYINHNIRGKEELDAEIALNRGNCEKLGLPLEIITIPESSIQNTARNEKMGIEAAAREYRYDALLKSSSSWILTAHHLDDQAETVIMRILQGSPLYKMEGIRRRNGRICRPMLSVPKEWITGLLVEEHLTYSFDSTNDDTDYARNGIRHMIIPHLSIEDKMTLARIAENVSEMNGRSVPLAYSAGRCYSFSRSAFLETSQLRREEVFFDINRDERQPERMSRSEVERFTEAIMKGTRAETSRFFLRVIGDEVRVWPVIPDMVFPVEGHVENDRFSLTFSDSPVDHLTLRFDPAKLRAPLLIRTSREGDIISLKEGKKAVRALEKEWKIPYSLVLEDGAGIAAVFGRFLGGRDRLSERFLGDSEKCVFVT